MLLGLALAIAVTTAFIIATAVALAVFFITSPTGPGSIFAAFLAFVKAAPLAYQIGVTVAAAVVGAAVATPAGMRFFKRSPEQLEIDEKIKEFVESAPMAMAPASRP